MVGGQTVTRRVSGLVKQRRRRAQKRADIRAGRKMSMQQMLQNTHTHNHVEPEPEVAAPKQVGYDLMRMGPDGPETWASGTQYQMRKLRTERMAVDPEYTYHLRKGVSA